MIVLHALYYDRLKLRSGADDQPDAATTRSQLQSDVSLVRENEALWSELMKLKLYVSDMQKNQGSSTKDIAVAAPTAHRVSKTYLLLIHVKKH
ncbi:ROOT PHOTOTROPISM PROTEIN-RELATED [Salix koriyanagi]|uniref:ROOT PHOTOTROPISM PROTEIN-RELATED n=1 Tax=Salix koriyanagi TaxID=2511006 RepID=A0A9Q0ZBP5_9ROSI|nr:ROOT PHOTOTROPISM PROTEIN-RELATED [Salix koriyanagi]